VRNQSPNSFDYFLLISLSAIFGMSFIFTNISVRDFPPLTVAAGRLFIALLIIYPVMRIKKQQLPAPGKIWVYIFLSALLGNALPFALISWGQIKVEASLAAIFMAIMPLATIVLAQFLTDDERINRWKLIAVMLGFVGIVVLMGFDSLSDLGGETLRQLAILLAAVCYALNAIVTRKLTSLPKYSMATALMIAACVLIVPFSLALDQPLSLSPGVSSFMAILALAIGPTAIATMLILIIIDRSGATFLSQINFMVPLFGVAFGTVLLHEKLSANAYWALAIIILALAISRYGQRHFCHPVVYLQNSLTARHAPETHLQKVL